MTTKTGTAEDDSEAESSHIEAVDAALDEALDGDSADKDDLRSLFSDS